MKRKNVEIVIIEDEEDILELLEYHFAKEGYDVTGFLSTENVEQFMEEESPSLLIVDRNLPGVEGSEFISNMREIGYDTPVIFLTAKDRDEDLQEGFKRGCDDYIIKPFKIKEVLLRVEALLRRSGVNQSDRLRYRDLILDNRTRELLIGNKKVNLTNLEYKLLYTFVKNAHQTLERDYLRDQVWGHENDNFHDKTINVAINRLKKKIDPTGKKEYFTPVWGVGYKLG
jgi:DNA-binding response OmpR family regulator